MDIPLDKYLATFTSPVTTTPFYSWGLTQRYPGGSGVGTSDPSAALRLGRDFQTTPVFKVRGLDIAGHGKHGQGRLWKHGTGKSSYGAQETLLHALLLGAQGQADCLTPAAWLCTGRVCHWSA